MRRTPSVLACVGAVLVLISGAVSQRSIGQTAAPDWPMVAETLPASSSMQPAIAWSCGPGSQGPPARQRREAMPSSANCWLPGRRLVRIALSDDHLGTSDAAVLLS